jgi:hypothetical protein
MFGLAGMAAGGSRTGMAMLSPAAALLTPRKKRQEPDRQQVLYPSEAR